MPATDGQCSCAAPVLHPELPRFDCASRETFVKQLDGESPNDRNDRAIRAAAAWYTRRLPKMRVILLTNDADNRRKAAAEGIDAQGILVHSHDSPFCILYASYQLKYGTSTCARPLETGRLRPTFVLSTLACPTPYSPQVINSLINPHTSAALLQVLTVCRYLVHRATCGRGRTARIWWTWSRSPRRRRRRLTPQPMAQSTGGQPSGSGYMRTTGRCRRSRLASSVAPSTRSGAPSDAACLADVCKGLGSQSTMPLRPHTRLGHRQRQVCAPAALNAAHIIASIGFRRLKQHPTVLQGTLRVSRYNAFEGFVASESVGQDILISGRVDMNR